MKHIWRIIKFTGSLWRYYAGIAVFTILIAAMSQLTPLLTKGVVDEITRGVTGGTADVKLVAIFAAAIFASEIGLTLFSNFGGYLGDMVSAKQQRILSQRYYAHIMSLPQRYFDTELTGKIISRMNRGIRQITDYTQMLSNNFLQFIFSTIFTLIIVAFYSWEVALMLLTLYPVFVWMTARTSKKWQIYQKDINENIDIANGRFAESVSQVRVVKSFVQEARELKFFGGFMQKVVTTTSPQSKYWHKHDIIRRSVLAVINLAIYAFIFIRTAEGQFTIGEMVLLVQYAQLIRIPLFSISFLVDRTQRAIADSKDYFAVMDEQPEMGEAESAPDLRVSAGKIEFRDVTFGYDKGKPVLKKLNFEIKPDTKIALVGESGQGKTTISNLLMRLYEPTSGTILIDGQDINKVNHVSLRQSVGTVFQESALFSGTIRENISYAKPDALDEQIISAAKAANAHEFVSKFEKGYDTEIGERGLRLSGGQKQRIAIARAILKDAPILVLDEATSSLDSRSENMVQEALERLMKNRTTLIIAHRLSTIQNVDTIITLKNGQVDEIGTPERLARSGGIYDELLKLQKGLTKDEKAEVLKAYDLTAN
jgi:ATP-binding cassette subfamily B protein